MYERTSYTDSAPALRHAGEWHRAIRRHGEEARDIASGKSPLSSISAFTRITDERFLYAALARCAMSPSASGPDRVLATALASGSTVWDKMRAQRDILRQGRYEHGPTREVRIPKAKGGQRPIFVANVIDRVVARSALLVLQPLINPLFAPESFAFRPGRGVLDALVALQRWLACSKRPVVHVADIAKAFDAVPRQPILDRLRSLGFDDQTVSLCSEVTETGLPVGVRQGCPLSPFLFNIFGDFALDRPFKNMYGDSLLIRYADDVAICAEAERADEVAGYVASLCRDAGTPFGESGAERIDVSSGAPFSWLGFHLVWDGRNLHATIGKRQWEKLTDGLAAVHQSNAPVVPAADAIIAGWLGYLGPCYRPADCASVIGRLREIGNALSLLELPPDPTLMTLWANAGARWCTKLMDTPVSGHGATSAWLDDGMPNTLDGAGQLAG